MKNPFKSLIEGINHLLGVVVGLVVGILFIPSTKRTVEQVMNPLIPNQIFNIADVVALYKRKLINRSTLRDISLKNGLSEDKVNLLVDLADEQPALNMLVQARHWGLIDEAGYNDGADKVDASQLERDLAWKMGIVRLNAGDVIEAWRRKIPGPDTDKTYFNDLRVKGFTDDRIAIMKLLSDRLPSMNELIGFTAWNVDDEAFAAKLKLDQGIPANFFMEADKIGVPEKLARRIYRSHWQVPSPFILKELFQTGQLSETELKEMLNAYMIAPAFLDSVVKAFYKPLSGSEISDLLKNGIIKQDQVAALVQKSGYSPDDTKLIAQNLINNVLGPAAAAKAAAEKRKADLHGLTLSNVISSYEEDLMSRNTAHSYLIQLGDTEAVAQLALTNADFKKAKTSSDSQIANIKANYAAGAINFNEVISQLAALKIPATQQDTILASLQKQKAVKTALPSKTELEKMAKKGVITVGGYIDGLRLLNYSDQSIANFLKLDGVDISGLGLNAQ